MNSFYKESCPYNSGQRCTTNTSDTTYSHSSLFKFDKLCAVLTRHTAIWQPLILSGILKHSTSFCPTQSVEILECSVSPILIQQRCSSAARLRAPLLKHFTKSLMSMRYLWFLLALCEQNNTQRYFGFLLSHDSLEGIVFILWMYLSSWQNMISETYFSKNKHKGSLESFGRCLGVLCVVWFDLELI